MYNEFPRSIMSSRDYTQRLCSSLEDFVQFVRTNNGKHDLYTSHNSYPGHKGKIADTNQVLLSRVYYDFDHDNKPENAQSAAAYQIDWHNANDLPFTLAFSGMKGFQVNTHFEPEVCPIQDFTEEHSLTDFYRAIYDFMVNDVGLRTLDMHCREPRRVQRIWNTLHLSSNLFCIPLTPKELELPFSEIKELAQQKRSVTGDWNEGTRKLTFREFIEEFDIRPAKKRKILPVAAVSSLSSSPTRKGMRPRAWFDAMFDPCISQTLYDHPNPAHQIRVASAVHLKNMADVAPVQFDENNDPYKIAPDPEWVNSFYKMMGKADVENEERRMIQIENIWNNNYQYPSCRTLFGYRTDPHFASSPSICVGHACPKFAKWLPDIAERTPLPSEEVQ